MLLYEFPTTADIKALFAEEIATAGGVVSDTFDDGARLFTRSVLPGLREVAKGDKVQGGVALKATEEEVSVHPYVFRLVCKNGAIAAHAIQSRQIGGEDFVILEEFAGAVRAAVRACCSPEAFTANAEQMRSAREMQADLALNLLPYLSRMSRPVMPQVFRSIMERFFGEPDRSAFALMNAVTSVARDSEDAELRWRLEELGGGICVGRRSTLGPGGRKVKLERGEVNTSRKLVGVG
jgi:hypothetical protein